MTKYYIGKSGAAFGGSVYEVEYEGIPPCLYCDKPVTSPSTDGPLVCPTCDMGCNENGKKWTIEENKQMHINFANKIKDMKKVNQ